MSLNQLYDWFESHMDDGVPWVKSSIRHTLCVHQAFTKSQGGRSNWRLSSNLRHNVQSMSPPHKSVTSSVHPESSSRLGWNETTFDDHWLGVPLENIPELDGTSAFASHTSTTTVEEQSVVDNPGTDFQLPPSVHNQQHRRDSAVRRDLESFISQYRTDAAEDIRLTHVTNGHRLSHGRRTMTDETPQSDRRKAHNIAATTSRKRCMDNMSKYHNELDALCGGRIWLPDNVEPSSISYDAILNVRKIIKHYIGNGGDLSKLWAPGGHLYEDSSGGPPGGSKDGEDLVPSEDPADVKGDAFSPQIGPDSGLQAESDLDAVDWEGFGGHNQEEPNQDEEGTSASEHGRHATPNIDRSFTVSEKPAASIEGVPSKRATENPGQASRPTKRHRPSTSAQFSLTAAHGFDIHCLRDGVLVQGTVIAEILRAGHDIFPFSTILLDPLLFTGGALPNGTRNRIDAEPTATIIAPINLLSKAKHWVLVVVTRPELSVKVLDSLPEATCQDELRSKLKHLLAHVKDEDGQTQALQPLEKSACPRQSNQVDCGVATICNGLYIMAGRPIPSSADYAIWRRAFTAFSTGERVGTSLSDQWNQLPALSVASHRPPAPPAPGTKDDFEAWSKDLDAYRIQVMASVQEQQTAWAMKREKAVTTLGDAADLFNSMDSGASTETFDRRIGGYLSAINGLEMVGPAEEEVVQRLKEKQHTLLSMRQRQAEVNMAFARVREELHQEHERIVAATTKL
ncbi:hypothetical protein CABS02_13254 [Colletotrichum abscissum]|uniref:Ubiquitin-like protease family profile domain-containing protein n=1 Tax=Colletotrichum abscissum TaxID=1671311 RepID=A0A9Q0AUM6_9PEZI|nr:hypothetical protein CABS02_13254 [Colletotrichum abscissum]